MASKETGLEVNAYKTKYMVMSRDQNAGRSHGMKIYNSSFERVEEFKYLGTNLTNQNWASACNNIPLQPNHTETPTHIEPRTIPPMW